MHEEGRAMGERIRRLREAAKMTRVELGERSGIPWGTIRNWEQGVRIPRLDLAVRAARALGVSMDVFSGMDEPEVKKKGGKR
jgi:transcriptional regulator with XRE-family HTH domain